MGNPQSHHGSPTARGNHFSCSLTAVLLARVLVHGGEEAVERLLREAASSRAAAYLRDIGNWVSYDEAIALFRAGEHITGDPLFARRLGEDAVRQLTGSPVAALLRSLGSPEEVYRQMAPTAAKFSTVVEPDFPEVGPGYAELRFVAREGFPRDPHHCQWTRGLLTQPTVSSAYLRRMWSTPSARPTASWTAAATESAGTRRRPRGWPIRRRR